MNDVETLMDRMLANLRHEEEQLVSEMLGGVEFGWNANDHELHGDDGIVTLSSEEYRLVEKPVPLLEAPRTPQYGRSPLREMYAEWWAGRTWSELYG